MTSDPMTFEDEPDDAFDPEDGSVDWTHVDELAAEHERILSIDDEHERLEAARAHVAKLSSGA